MCGCPIPSILGYCSIFPGYFGKVHRVENSIVRRCVVPDPVTLRMQCMGSSPSQFTYGRKFELSRLSRDPHNLANRLRKKKYILRTNLKTLLSPDTQWCRTGNIDL